MTDQQDPQSSAPANPPAAQDRSFSQTEVDRIVSERLTRERQKFEDYDVLKDKASKFDEYEAQSKSDLQKAQELAQAAEQGRTKALAELEALRIQQAVFQRAIKSEAVDPDVVLALVNRSELQIADDGTVTGVDEAVAKVLEDKPFLRKSESPTPGTGGIVTPTGGADGGPRGSSADGQLTREDLASMTSEEIANAKSEGRLNTVLGIST